MKKIDFEPISIDLIDADIDVAKDIFYKIYNSDTPTKINPKMMNLCAYHAAQAIEKTLKFIYYRDTGRQDMTHNISELLVDVEMNRKGYIHEHREMTEQAHFITNLNNARYGGSVSRDTAYKILNIAKGLYKELCQEFGKPQYEMFIPQQKEKGQDKDNNKPTRKNRHQTEKE